jgi:hypothetical protein
LQRHGVETKTERVRRIFPASDDMRDVVQALKRYMTEHGVKVRFSVRVTGIQVAGGQLAGVQTERETLPGSAVILATGGTSYPATGSTSDGYDMAAAIGYTIVKLCPALVPLVVHEVARAKSMQGISLRNVRLTAFQCPANEIVPSLTPASDMGRDISGKQPRPPVIESRMGEMMMTHFGKEFLFHCLDRSVHSVRYTRGTYKCGAFSREHKTRFCERHQPF